MQFIQSAVIIIEFNYGHNRTLDVDCVGNNCINKFAIMQRMVVVGSGSFQYCGLAWELRIAIKYFAKTKILYEGVT